VDLILHGNIVLLMDYKLACEYRDVASRPKHLHASGLSHKETERFIQILENIAEPILVLSRYRPMSSDPDDDMVLDVAINGHANAIITNNVKHLRQAAGNFGIEVFTPFELLEGFRKESGNDT
jgi:putative PIN family toxin of toxin-antitoxin system